MLKKLIIFTLFASTAAIPMQRPGGWGLNPLSGIGFTADTNETLKEVATNATSTAKAVSQGFASLSEGVESLSAGLSDATANLTQAVNGASKNIKQTVTGSTIEICNTINHATDKISDSTNRLIDAGLPGLHANVRRLVDQGVGARISIDPTTIKTLGFSTIGAALAMAGISLILYESFFVEDYAIEDTPKPTSWSTTIKNFAKNRYVLGSASIAAGLCLIAKSTSL